MVMEHRVSRLEGAYEQVDVRLESLDQHLEALRAETSARFDRQQAETARLIAEQGDRFERLLKEQQAETAQLIKEQNDRLERLDDKMDRHHAENTQRIDAQNRLIVAVTGLALTAAGVVIGLVAAGVV